MNRKMKRCHSLAEADCGSEKEDPGADMEGDRTEFKQKANCLLD